MSEKDDSQAFHGPCLFRPMVEELRAEVKALREALTEALPWLERGEKFYKFQRPGREFFPNREEAEGVTNRVRAALSTPSPAPQPPSEGR